jgi:HAD superfamily hydrolase (TIGR01457 family)
MSAATLLDRIDVLLADLDGTLYRGASAVPGAVEAVRAVIERGARPVYVTNNAARTPAAVAEQLAGLGFPASSSDVRTSAQAAAALLARRLPAGAPVLVVGTDALVDEVVSAGLVATRDAADVLAVVQGHDPATAWPILAEAAIAVRAGALWVACNVDVTLPTERGLLPGNGAMVAALRAATGRRPEVAGKPTPTLFEQAVQRLGARTPLVVGDRLDTDIAAGRAAGMPTLLVLTGVSGAADLLAAPAEQRPDHVGADLGALTAPVASLGFGECTGWEVRAAGSGLLHLTAGPVVAEPLDALRALCAVHWSTGGGPVRVEPGDEAASAALAILGIERVSRRPDQPTATVVWQETADRSRERSAQPSSPTEPSASAGCTGANQVIAPL